MGSESSDFQTRFQHDGVTNNESSQLETAAAVNTRDKTRETHALASFHRRLAVCSDADPLTHHQE